MHKQVEHVAKELCELDQYEDEEEEESLLSNYQYEDYDERKKQAIDLEAIKEEIEQSNELDPEQKDNLLEIERTLEKLKPDMPDVKDKYDKPFFKRTKEILHNLAKEVIMKKQGEVKVEYPIVIKALEILGDRKHERAVRAGIKKGVAELERIIKEKAEKKQRELEEREKMAFNRVAELIQKDFIELIISDSIRKIADQERKLRKPVQVVMPQRPLMKGEKNAKEKEKKIFKQLENVYQVKKD